MARARISTIADLEALLDALPGADARAQADARAHDAQLTKPPGALGALEELVVWLAGWQGRALPRTEPAQILVFAGNHGVAARGVSAFPAAVTAQMVANFAAGGAAICQLADLHGARLSIHALDLAQPTADFTESAAMTEAEMLEAVATGWEAVDPEAALMIPGEMGIGNTTVAAALCHGLFGAQPADWVGRGTGVDDAGLRLKAQVVAEGVARHAPEAGQPVEVLRCLGGREIAAMAGAILAARHARVPVLLDGFVSCTAAAVLARANPDALAHCRAAHRSAEAGHGRLLEALGLDPLLDLRMRLGEGSGAGVALGLLRAATACHAGMASFEQAGVTRG